ncbi:type III secretion system inner rod subunit SctI [Xanthomonas theicola]|uniref:Uncharacterized protein n=1 Tax=Xanthomonas theicola TaxID=56464 RepID=A0A2S6ZE84_9XANT|nr:type III secretion system inner rod subunit SctI [Xanthomonas theicola]PPT90460.1 hypothetical protein XthCFBP4691_12340 [Xanthomonas theicola]QNH25234.1 hypothetical protein G4Q83_11465 [Xanthomonas theicola]
MNTQAIAGVQRGAEIRAADLTPQESASSSIDDRLRDAFASTSVEAQNEYADIMAKASDAAYRSSPGALVLVQARMAERTLKVQHICGLVHQGVVTVQTLLKT